MKRTTKMVPIYVYLLVLLVYTPALCCSFCNLWSLKSSSVKFYYSQVVRTQRQCILQAIRWTGITNMYSFLCFGMPWINGIKNLADSPRILWECYVETCILVQDVKRYAEKVNAVNINFETNTYSTLLFATRYCIAERHIKYLHVLQLPRRMSIASSV